MIEVRLLNQNVKIGLKFSYEILLIASLIKPSIYIIIAII